MEDKKYVLEGIFTEFSKWTRNRPYYTDEQFKDLKKYTRRVKIKNILNDKTREI